MPTYFDEKRKSWYVKYSTKDPVTGKRKQIMKRGFPKQKDAKKWESEQIASAPSKTTATFMQMFEENLKFLNSSETSANMKRSWVMKHFPYCDTPIEKITKPMLIEWRNGLEGKLATRTINRGLGYIKSTFSYASDIYGTLNNGAVLRSYKLAKEDKQEMEIWTPEEFNQFLECVHGEYYRAYFAFLYWSGCRRSEGLAVCKDDFDGNKVHIWRSIKHYRNGFRSLKTDSSERTITLDKKTMDLLQPLIDAGNPFIFGGQRSLSITCVQREFERAIKESGVKKIRIHDLRHSHASVLIAAGVPVLAVSRRLGHSSVTITLNTYSHLLSQTETEMVATIDGLREKEKV